MNYKILLLFLLYSSNAFGYLNFSKGNYLLQGKILVVKGSVFLAINYRSNSETRIRLKNSSLQELLTQTGSNAALKVFIPRSFCSFIGEAYLIEIDHFLDPFEDVEVYHDDAKLPSK